MPEGMGIPVRPFRLHLLGASGDAPHDLGEILTPAQMAAKVPAGASPEGIDAATRQAIAALVGCGPQQCVPHLYTRFALAWGLDRLRDFALAGDLDAMRALGNVLFEAVADLGELARRRPEIVREWSRKQNVVPVLTGRNVGHRKQLAAALDAFAVGEASPYRVNPPPGRKAPDSSTAANVLAGHLCQHLHAHQAIFFVLQKPVPEWVQLASKLPPLSQANWESWADAAWACVLDASNGHPEKSDAMKRLGAKGARTDGLQTPRTLAANVRAEIRQTLREAIRTLASVGAARLFRMTPR